MADNAAVVDDAKQADMDFNSGFTPDTPLETPAATVQADAKPEVPPKAETKTDAIVPVEVKPEVIPPKYRQITEDEWTKLQTDASKALTPEKVKDIIAGTMGDFEQRIVKKLQAQTPAGQTIEIPKATFAKLRKDFPELADVLESDMSDILKGVRGTGPAEKDPDAKPDYEAVSKLVREATVTAQTEALEDLHPTWREIVGSGPEDDKPFRKWLATQTPEYQHRINATNSAVIIGRAIDKFLKAQTAPAPTPPAPKVVARKDRIADAIQPRGDGNPPPPSKTATDDFHAGFADG